MKELASDGGEISKKGIFSGLLGDLDVSVSRLEKIYEDRFYLKLWKPEIDLESLGIEFPKRTCMSVMWLQGFHKKLTEVNSNCH